MARLIDADALLEKQYRIDDSATLSSRDVVNVEDIEDAPTVEAIPKTDIQKAIDKVEEYICDIEKDTVKAQGMAQALDIFEQTLKAVEKVNSCSECEFFGDSRFYADNSIFVSWGSCMKCQRNMTTTDPYQEIPTWCPLKGE